MLRNDMTNPKQTYALKRNSVLTSSRINTINVGGRGGIPAFDTFVMCQTEPRSSSPVKSIFCVFMVEPCILRSIDCLLPTNALNVNFI
jgi:hypothetical protein